MEDTSSKRLLDEGRNKGPRLDREEPLYNERRTNPTALIMQYAFIGVVIIMVLITFILSIYRSATAPSGSLYIMLGLSLLGFVALELIMVQFLRKGDLPSQKTWFVYLVGGCVVLEAIFTDVLLFH